MGVPPRGTHPRRARHCETSSHSESATSTHPPSQGFKFCKLHRELLEPTMGVPPRGTRPRRARRCESSTHSGSATSTHPPTQGIMFCKHHREFLKPTMGVPPRGTRPRRADTASQRPTERVRSDAPAHAGHLHRKHCLRWECKSTRPRKAKICKHHREPHMPTAGVQPRCTRPRRARHCKPEAHRGSAMSQPPTQGQLCSAQASCPCSEHAAPARTGPNQDSCLRAPRQ